MIERNNCCVCCGNIIPEGWQYCGNCYEDAAQIISIKKYMQKKNTRKQRILGIFNKLKNKIPLLGG